MRDHLGQIRDDEGLHHPREHQRRDACHAKASRVESRRSSVAHADRSREGRAAPSWRRRQVRVGPGRRDPLPPRHRRRRGQGDRRRRSSSTPTRGTSRCCRASAWSPCSAPSAAWPACRASRSTRDGAARRAGHRDPPADPDAGEDRERTGASPASTTRARRALIVVEVETKERAATPLFTNRFSIFARGEGGFGGESGPEGRATKRRRASPTPSSSRRPCRSRRSSTASRATRTRCTPTPTFAKLGGFDKPILHGLCSFGIVCKAVVDALLGGDVDQGRALPGALRRRALPRRDDRDLDVARGQPDPHQREVQGARRARHQQRRHHAADRQRSQRTWDGRCSSSASA